MGRPAKGPPARLSPPCRPRWVADDSLCHLGLGMPVSGCASPEVLQCTHLKGARSDRRYRVLGPHPRPARSWESPLRQSGHSRVLCGRRPPGKGLRPRPWATHGSAETRFPGSSELTPFTSGMRSSGSAAIASSCPKTRGGARPPGGCFFFCVGGGTKIMASSSAAGISSYQK